jgi:hypothetical protein
LPAISKYFSQGAQRCNSSFTISEAFIASGSPFRSPN